jgi:hypothetical protein
VSVSETIAVPISNMRPNFTLPSRTQTLFILPRQFGALSDRGKPFDPNSALAGHDGLQMHAL